MQAGLKGSLKEVPKTQTWNYESYWGTPPPPPPACLCVVPQNLPGPSGFLEVLDPWLAQQTPEWLFLSTGEVVDVDSMWVPFDHGEPFPFVWEIASFLTHVFGLPP